MQTNPKSSSQTHILHNRTLLALFILIVFPLPYIYLRILPFECPKAYLNPHAPFLHIFGHVSSIYVHACSWTHFIPHASFCMSMGLFYISCSRIFLAPSSCSFLYVLGSISSLMLLHVLGPISSIMLSFAFFSHALATLAKTCL